MHNFNMRVLFLLVLTGAILSHTRSSLQVQNSSQSLSSYVSLNNALTDLLNEKNISFPPPPERLFEWIHDYAQIRRNGLGRELYAVNIYQGRAPEDKKTTLTDPRSLFAFKTRSTRRDIFIGYTPLNKQLQIIADGAS
jgi:hypothetical protein